ncbi:MAG: rhomboid family intramembrane serine protease [Bacteroidota bacterium]
MFRMTGVVRNLLIINVIIFILTELVNPELKLQFALHYPESPYFRPFQLVTHFFTHGGLTHILFNMFGLVIFGGPLESIWGPKKFLIYYLISAAGAAFLHLAMAFLGVIEAAPAVGASGAIYGLLIAFAMKFPNTELMLIFLPVPIKAKYFVPGLIALDLILGFGSFGWDPIAHFAHLGGALFGFLLLLYWKEVNSGMYS